MINFNVQIRDFPFSGESQALIEQWKKGDREYGTNWPVVYLLHNDETREAYVGETLNAGKRAAQHWQLDERKRLKTIHIMTDDTFNKSVILDLESFLIKYISADQSYTLQNGNTGLSDFDYYGRDEYEKEFQKVWECLRKHNLVRSGVAELQNSDFFKYSPYKALTQDQGVVLGKILSILTLCLKEDMRETVLVEGGAGTGKTILAIYLLKLLSDLKSDTYEQMEEVSESKVTEWQALLTERKFKMGYVVPQSSLQQTLKKVFRTIRGLPESLVMSPREAIRAAKDAPFDLLICDEAHRLKRRAGLSQYQSYDEINREFNLPADTTELEWVIRSSRMQILFYDSAQTVRPSDVPTLRFNQILNEQENRQKLKLSSQLRCLAGDDYIQYVHDILNFERFGIQDSYQEYGSAVMRENFSTWPQPKVEFKNFKALLYDDVDEMVDEINRLNQEIGLCYTVAGYGWKWITKKEPKNTPKRDIDIGRGYIWNRTNTDWIGSKPLPYEIGCIHTVQGYDLNYVGVIFGPEIYYDRKAGRIDVDKKKYYDSLGKTVGDDHEALRTYILNVYQTLLTRGIRGVLIYVCDPALREYLRPFFQDDAE